MAIRTTRQEDGLAKGTRLAVAAQWLGNASAYIFFSFLFLAEGEGDCGSTGR